MGSRGGSSRLHSSVSDLSLDEQEPRLRRQCQSLLKNALASPFNIAKESGWSLKHEKQGVQVYRKSLEDKEVDKYVCTGTLKTTLPCLAWGLYAASTDDLRIFASILYESEFMDAKVVRVFEAATADDSFKFSGVKYMKTQMPVQSAHGTRDAVYFEYSGCRTLPNGLRYLFIVQDAMQSKQVPPQKNVARESITMVYLFHELADGRVQFTMESSVLPNGVIPTWFTAYSYWQTMVRLESLPEIRSIVTARQFLGAVTWVPDSARKHCHVCVKRFNPLRTRHHCRSCGDIMCSACTVRIAYTPLFLQSEPSQKAMQEHKICAKCIALAKRDLAAHPLRAIDPSKSAYMSPSSPFDTSPLVHSSTASPVLFRKRSCPDDPEGDVPTPLPTKETHLRWISASDPLAQHPAGTQHEARKWVSMDGGHPFAEDAHDLEATNPFQSMALTSPTGGRKKPCPAAGAGAEGFIVCQFNGSALEAIQTTSSGLTLSIAHQN